MRDLIWYDRHLVGFGNRLKGENRVKDKIAESLAVKGRTVDDAMQLILDAIQYHEADYTRHVREDVALIQQRHADLVRLGNLWHGDRFKGISSLWRHRGTGQIFEVQFHTEISYHAMQLIDRACGWLRSARTYAQGRSSSKPSSARCTRTFRSRRARPAFPRSRPATSRGSETCTSRTTRSSTISATRNDPQAC